MSSVGNLPPATPAYILRGHTVPVHALCFYLNNAFLLSGDSEGWIVVWALASKRPVACWKGHDGGVLAIKGWKSSVITHGRDHSLRVWQLKESSFDGETLDMRLPAEQGEAGKSQRREPWLLHSMAVSALNFCAFALCIGGGGGGKAGSEREGEAYVAVPNALDSGGIDIFHLPSERRVSVLKSDTSIKTGMVMALDLLRHPETDLLTVISGYEDGHTMVHRRNAVESSDGRWVWDQILVSRPHTQPVLSLDTTSTKNLYFTSSADAIIAKFALPGLRSDGESGRKAVKVSSTKHAGQQDLKLRDDDKIFATAGWDARVRVYSVKSLRELAVLKWHQEGCYSIAFAAVSLPEAHPDSQRAGQLPVTVERLGGSALDMIKQQRSIKAQQTHWLAAGGKDGKISLWDIY